MNEAENFHPPEYAAYRKLLPHSFANQEDALQMDRLKMLIEYGADPF